jgi:hypothetical protein
MFSFEFVKKSTCDMRSPSGRDPWMVQGSQRPISHPLNPNTILNFYYSLETNQTD